MGNFKVGFIVFSLENSSDFPDFCMSSNLGLYPGHLEDYVMRHWFVLKFLGELLICFSLFLQLVMWVSSHKFCLTFYGRWFNVSSVLKFFAFLFQSALMCTTQGSDWYLSSSLYHSSVLRGLLSSFHACVVEGESRHLLIYNRIRGTSPLLVFFLPVSPL